MKKKNNPENLNCPNNCIKESLKDNPQNMCYESCEDIYEKCSTTCNIVCECDPTGTCLPKCRNNCPLDLLICKEKCDNIECKSI